MSSWSEAGEIAEIVRGERKQQARGKVVGRLRKAYLLELAERL